MFHRNVPAMTRTLLLAAMLLAGCQTQPAVVAVTATPPPVPPGFGMVSGQINVPLDRTSSTSTSMTLFFEEAYTHEVVPVPFEPNQETYSANLLPGTYYAYTYLPGFEEQGAFTNCQPDQTCSEHALRAFAVTDGQVTQGVSLNDWYPVETTPIVLLGSIIDGTGESPVEDGAIVIIDERIVAVGTRSEVNIPTNAQTFDLGGATILPGFINAHVHDSYVERLLQQWAQAGVTTVRDMGASVGFPYFARRDAFNTDPYNARLVSAGPIITVPDGAPMSMGGLNSLTVTSPEDARQQVNQLIDDGADIIKIIVEPGAGPYLSLEEATAIVETAHERGLSVSTHAIDSALGLQISLDAGVDELAHMYPGSLSDELIQHLIDNDIYIVPTLGHLRGGGTTNLQRFVDAGGHVALGDVDYVGSGRGNSMPMREIHAMLGSGLSHMQIIVAATRNAAHVCSLDNLLGTLEVGKLADVLVVSGDPLENIQALTEVLLVVHNGIVIRSEVE